MTRAVVSEHARRDIDRLVRRLLRDSGSSEPPVNVEEVLQVLDLDLEFYDLEEPRLLKRIQHRVKVGATMLAEYLDKIKLRALLLFDERRVLLDKDLPKVKHDWATAHEAGHRLIPWHREFWRGDTLETLDPAWHEELEAEANYAASRLLFCGEFFTKEAQDTQPCWTTDVFHGECFYNGYYVMSLLVHQGPAATLVAAGNRALR